MLIALQLNLLYQFWIHADWIPKLGWLEYVLNTPSAHRVHHARNPEYLDANYGGVLIVFDRLFGTYIEERADVPCDYGLVSRSRPTIRSASTSSRGSASLRTSRSARSLARPGCLFGPPGWRPDGKGLTTPAEALLRSGSHGHDLISFERFPCPSTRVWTAKENPAWPRTRSAS